jgi:hypothetical protein
MLAQMVVNRLPVEDQKVLDLLSPYRAFEGQEKLK